MADRDDREGDVAGDACPPPEALRRFGIGDLPRPERERVASHVEGCPACASSMEALGDPADTLVEALRQPLDEVSLPQTAMWRLLGEPTLSDGMPPAGAGLSPPVILPYRLLRPLARGGLGRVWVAFDPTMGREVALKEIRPDLADDPGCRARFLREARVTGLLEHPGVVPVYGMGIDAAGHFYYVMRLVGGETLQEAIDRLHGGGGAEASDSPGRPSGLRPLLGRFVTACNAVAFAHSRGVLHRDLKPANILLGTYGETYVVDWGLADTRGSVVADGDPEPAGSMPPSEAGPGETRDGQAMGTPAYASPEQAAGMAGRVGPAADVYGLGATLYHLLTGRAPYPGRDPKAVLEAVRLGGFDPPRLANPAVPRALEAICLRALAFGPGDRYPTPLDLAADVERWLNDEPVAVYRESWTDRLARWVRRHRARARVVAISLVTMIGVLLVAALTVDRARRVAVAALGRAELAARESRTLAASLALDRGDTLLGRGEAAEGLDWLRRGLLLSPDEAADLRRAARIDLAAWWAAVPRLRAHMDRGEPAWAVALSPDGSRVLSGGEDATARLWDAATGRPAGPRLVGHGGTILAAAFAPDGRTAMTASNDGTARLWDAATGRPLKDLRAGSPVTTAAFTPDGAAVATGSDDGRVRLWDLATGTRLGPELDHPGGLRALAFGPDGRSLATACKDDRLVRLWDVRSGEPAGPSREHPGEVHALAVSPDGETVLAGCDDNRAYLWRRATGAPVGVPLEHSSWVVDVAFAPDGRSALTASYDDTARLWEVPSCRPIGLPARHTADLSSVAFGPDGRTFATAGLDGCVRIWDVPRGPAPVASLEHPGRLSAVAFGPDGRSLATFCTVADGARGELRAWDAAGERLIDEPRVLPVDVTAVCFGIGGRVVATGHEDQSIRIWDADTGRMTRTISTDSKVSSLALDPAGRAVLAGGWGKARLWNVADGAPIGDPLKHGHEVTVLAFAPDGRTVLTAGTDDHVRLWERGNGRQVHELVGANGGVLAVAFSPDGRLIAAGGRDQTAQIWEADTGAPLGVPLLHRGEVWSVAFSPDGRTLATGEEGVARLWDVATGRLLGPPLPHRGLVTALAFRPDGRAVATGDEGAARLWPLPEPAAGDIERIALEAEVRTGLAVDDQGELHLLDAEAWGSRRRSLGDEAGPP